MSSQELQLLLDKIKQLNTNLQFFKKTLDRDECKSNQKYIKEQSERPKLEKAIDNINDLSADIKRKFQSTKFTNQDKLKVQKFEKDFMNKMQVYTNLLKNYQDQKTKELRQLRQTVSKRRETIHKSKQQRDDDQQQSEHGAHIELQDVNQQTLFYEHMIQLKQKQLLQVKSKMQEALKVQKQVGKLVNAQGEKIDIIEQNVDSARSNVKQAGNLLEQGVQHHKSATRKKMCIIAIIFILLLVIIVPILIKFL